MSSVLVNGYGSADVLTMCQTNYYDHRREAFVKDPKKMIECLKLEPVFGKFRNLH